MRNKELTTHQQIAGTPFICRDNAFTFYFTVGALYLSVVPENTLIPTMVGFWFEAPHPYRKSSLASYFLFKILVFETFNHFEIFNAHFGGWISIFSGITQDYINPYVYTSSKLREKVRQQCIRTRTALIFCFYRVKWHLRIRKVYLYCTTKRATADPEIFNSNGTNGNLYLIL